MKSTRKTSVVIGLLLAAFFIFASPVSAQTTNSQQSYLSSLAQTISNLVEIVNNLAEQILALSSPGGSQLASGIGISAPTSGLVAYWNFDEVSGGTAGDSIGGNTGILVNGPAWTTGKIGNALDFDGVDDYVNVGTNSALNITGDVTVSAWVKHDTSLGADVVVGKLGNSLLPYSIRIDGNDYVNFDQMNGTAPQSTLTSNGKVPLGIWTHVAVVRSGGTRSIYINGTLDKGPTAYTKAGGASTVPFVIGNISTIGSDYFDGAIDDVRVYNRALSSFEVQDLFASATGTTGSQPPVIASTKFTIKDSVEVNTPNSSLNVRDSANGTKYTQKQPDKAVGTVIGGPTQAGSFVWWEVDFSNTPDGWVAEDFIEVYVAPAVTPPTTTPPPATPGGGGGGGTPPTTTPPPSTSGGGGGGGIAPTIPTQPTTTPEPVVKIAKVNTGDGSRLRVRDQAGTQLGLQQDGASGTVNGGSISRGGYTWWNVDFGSGTDGWVAEDFITIEEVSSTTQTTQPTTQTSTYTFTRNLKLGSRGDDVLELQKFLNNNGFTIATAGAGSVNNETTYFGPATKSALVKYQNTYREQILTPVGLTTGSGYFGSSTINHIHASGSTQAQTSSTTKAELTQQINSLLLQVVDLQGQLDVLQPSAAKTNLKNQLDDVLRQVAEQVNML